MVLFFIIHFYLSLKWRKAWNDYESTRYLHVYIYSLKQLKSVGENVGPHQQLENTVTVDNGVGSDTTFLVTWQTSGPPEIVLFDPNGRKYHTHNFIINEALRTARLCIPGTAKVSAVSLFVMTIFSQVGGFQLNCIIKCIVWRKSYSDTSKFDFKFMTAFCEY